MSRDGGAGSLDLPGPLVLVGAGKMGIALLDGWLGLGVDPAAVIALDPSPAPDVVARLSAIGVKLNPSEVPKPAVVLLAVKPQVFDAALPSFAPHVAPSSLVISILAGKTLAALGKGFPPGTAIIRSMPNTPAAVGRGVTVLVANAHVSDAQRELAYALLSAVGEAAWIEDEAQMDAVTAVSGSGPAYVFLLAEALAEAGVKAGLPPELAAHLARATVSGAGELLHRSDQTPEILRKNVTSPGGTTAAALDVLMASDGFEPLLTRAVARAAARSRELAG